MAEPEVGLRVIPGQWRPHYPQEQIAWVHPPWFSQDYVWLDFPETLWHRESICFLSHHNPAFEVAYPDEPEAPWTDCDGGIAFRRVFPDGIELGGSLTVADEMTLRMELRVRNGSPEPFDALRFQTCAYLRAIREFGDYTNWNKFVHTPKHGWAALEEALHWPHEPAGTCSLGWGRGPKVADLPVTAVCSNTGDHLVAMTWGDSTCTLVGNPEHPCMHADPFMPDLAPGAEARIVGELIFVEGTLAEFEEHFRTRPSPSS